MQNKRKDNKKTGIGGVIAAGALLLCTPVYAEPAGEANQETVKNGAYAEVNSCLNIREGAGTQYRVTAQLPKNGYCEIIRDEGEWCYISSEAIEGYVFKGYLAVDMTIEEYLEKTGLQDAVYACSLEQEPQLEAAAAIPESKRQEVVNYALQFVGNPYVWGGTSLTDGADCSGFVQSVYRDFGVALPRVAADQANAGTRISPEEAQPGDLIFYADNGYIYHVVLYIGNGQVVHASSAATGIKVSNVYWERAVSAVRLLE